MGFLSLSIVLSVTMVNSSWAKRSDLVLPRSEYFSSFDYKNPNVRARAEALEVELIRHSTEILNWANLNEGITNPNAGMYLVYTAMLILDRNNGYLEGVLADSAIDKTKILERYDLAQTFLDQGIKLAPDDDRIQSWNIANVLRREKLATGKVSDQTLDRILELTVKSPIFHLFNALTMASDTDFGEARENTLLRFAEKLSGKESPCWPPIFRSGEAKKCNTTKKTPFAFQGVTTYLGDEFLKHAFAVSVTNPTEAKLYEDKAMKMYQRLQFFLFRRKTKKWNQKENLQARIDLIEHLKVDQALSTKTEFLKSRTFLDIYTCVSCHQDGHSKKDLEVSLPAPQNTFK